MRKKYVFKRYWPELLSALAGIMIPVALFCFLAIFILSSFKDMEIELVRSNGFSGIIAKGIDAIEDFKDDVNKQRKNK